MANQPFARSEWKPFSAEERESFLAAIARHRRASWRVSAACGVAVLVLAATAALLIAPLLFCLIGLAFDVVNLAVQAPDLIGRMGRAINPLLSSRTVAWTTLVRVGAIAASPGFLLMAIATLALRHVWTTSPLFNAGDPGGRPPDRGVVEEERLVNVVEEMAIAAGIAAPRVVVVSGGINAAACGRDETHATIIAGRDLTTCVNREQLEGMLAHLIGSIANGDMTIGLRVTTTLSLFGLFALVGTSLGDRGAFHRTTKLWRVFVAPTSAGTVALLSALADPFSNRASAEGTPSPSGNGKLTWREWVLMPLMGPLVLSGFLSGMLTGFLLQPLVALAWRQRKYMADATAVQLTRDPDALASALSVIADRPTGLVPWAAHLAVAPARGGAGTDGPFGESMVPIFPSVEKRVAALAKMGAHVAPGQGSHVPWPLALVFGLFIAVIAALMGVVVYLLVLVSAALSGMFTVMPALILHALLRWVGR